MAQAAEGTSTPQQALEMRNSTLMRILTYRPEEEGTSSDSDTAPPAPRGVYRDPAAMM